MQTTTGTSLKRSSSEILAIVDLTFDDSATENHCKSPRLESPKETLQSTTTATTDTTPDWLEISQSSRWAEIRNRRIPLEVERKKKQLQDPDYLRDILNGLIDLLNNEQIRHMKDWEILQAKSLKILQQQETLEAELQLATGDNSRKLIEKQLKKLSDALTNCQIQTQNLQGLMYDPDIMDLKIHQEAHKLLEERLKREQQVIEALQSPRGQGNSFDSKVPQFCSDFANKYGDEIIANALQLSNDEDPELSLEDLTDGEEGDYEDPETTDNQPAASDPLNGGQTDPEEDSDEEDKLMIEEY